MKAWTNETIMPWGKHQGKPLRDIPVADLLWLLEQPWIKDWPPLYAYLHNNEQSLRLVVKDTSASSENDTGYNSYDDYLKDYRGF